MKKNLEQTGGLIFSEHVLLALTRKGVVRDQAYRMVQRNAMQVWEQGGDFPALLKQDKDIQKHLTDKEIDKAFDMKSHLKNVNKIFNRVFK
jgi:adenylosuccinate lyase